MPPLDLTPLDTLPAFTPAICTQLQEYWLTSAQEFLDVLTWRDDNGVTGETHLMRLLGFDQEGMDRLYAAAVAAVPSVDFGQDEMAEDALFGGCIFDPADELLPLSFAAGEPPPDTLLAPPDWPADDQGQRNTCVAFTATAMYRVLAQRDERLSEQFLFWAGKQHDPVPNNPHGIAPDYIFTALQHQGVCAEAYWPYHPNKVYLPASQEEDMAQGPAPAEALADARQRTIVTFDRVNPKDVDAIQELVYQGKPVLIGMSFHRYWYASFQGASLGRIRPPFPGDRLGGGHAMCVVGFRADARAPGGGYFVVRNSWGDRCGAQNEDGVGYCHIPYRMVSQYNRAAYYITALNAR